MADNQLPSGHDIEQTITRTAQTALYIGTDALLIKIQNASPIKTGTLRRSHTITRNGRTVTISANTPYAARLHDGGPEYTITPVNAKALYWPGAKHPVRKVTHKATKGRPWITQTVEANLDALGNFICDEIVKALGAL